MKLCLLPTDARGNPDGRSYRNGIPSYSRTAMTHKGWNGHRQES
ncbi:hypothetical protein EVA_21518 [gut metagenome]|uniref:Uncharacterized protein n=1 Tax=gut metagenome TaxID=749906 RepID=J9BS22_9ZZZZ